MALLFRCNNKLQLNLTRFLNVPACYSAKWDKNWDHRDPKSITEPPKTNNTEDLQKYNEALEKCKSKAVRNFYLINDCQYRSGNNKYSLTELGRKQADLTGKRLAAFDLKFDALIRDDFKPASETASIIAKHLNKDIKVTDWELNGLPILPEPPFIYGVEEYKVFQDGARMEAAFRRYFYRAPPEQTHDTNTLLVCEENPARFFICRALQFPAEAWYRMIINQGSITWISIQPNGYVNLRGYSDTGFMEPKDITQYKYIK